MLLTLTVTSPYRLAPGRNSVKIKHRDASIGRAPGNDWILQDPERVISGFHCYISYQNGEYHLTDTSTNGVYLNANEQRLGRGNSVRLNDGDFLTLGEYEIQVSLDSGADDDIDPSLEITAPPITDPDTGPTNRRPDDPVLAAKAAREPAAPAPYTASPEDVERERQAMGAFLEGLGMPHLELPDAETAQLMQALGLVFRQTVQGLMNLLEARRRVKKNLHLALTQARPVANNPLKCSRDIDECITRLLTRRDPGLMPPVRAVQDAFAEIEQHQEALFAGLRAGQQQLLARFDPEQVETKLNRESVLDAFVPAKRKAKYWDLFNDLYADSVREAQEDFLHESNTAFARAYNRVTRKN